MRTDSFNWFYKGDKFNPISLEELSGFVYKLVYEDELGQDYTYYGRKSFWSYTTLPALRNGTVREGANRIAKNVKGKRTYFDVTRKESKWKDYEGSCKDVPEGLILVYKIIVKLCETNLDTTYWEAYYLFTKEVLFDTRNLNNNILGSFFSGKVTGSKSYLK